MTKKREYIYVGIQDGIKGEKYRVYIDLETKSSFLVGENENVAEKLREFREQFNRKENT